MNERGYVQPAIDELAAALVSVWPSSAYAGGSGCRRMPGAANK